MIVRVVEHCLNDLHTMSAATSGPLESHGLLHTPSCWRMCEKSHLRFQSFLCSAADAQQANHHDKWLFQSRHRYLEFLTTTRTMDCTLWSSEGKRLVLELNDSSLASRTVCLVRNTLARRNMESSKWASWWRAFLALRISCAFPCICLLLGSKNTVLSLRNSRQYQT